MVDSMGGFNPFDLSSIVEKQVTRRSTKGTERRYYRFRGAKWYGGIATGDVVGCNLRCKFCWSWKYSYYNNKGWFECPESALERLLNIARKNKYKYLRLSGGEPTIGFSHLQKLLELHEATDHPLTFILETNGLLLGKYPEYSKAIAQYSKLAVRVSFKGCSQEEFETLTGAMGTFYEYQYAALENLINAGLKPCDEVYAAVMLSFTTAKNYSTFKDRLSSIHPDLANCIDEEYVILYPHVRELLNKNGLVPKIAYDPSGVPNFMI